jgi:hypothetical protein
VSFTGLQRNKGKNKQTNQNISSLTMTTPEDKRKQKKRAKHSIKSNFHNHQEVQAKKIKNKK